MVEQGVQQFNESIVPPSKSHQREACVEWLVSKTRSMLNSILNYTIEVPY